MATSDTISNLLDERRTFAAPPALVEGANVTSAEHARAAADPVAFWAEASQRLDWHTPWTVAHTWKPVTEGPGGELTVPEATWFADGTLNVAVNCVDRHVDAGLGDKVALHVEGEPGDRRDITYAQLQREVVKAANGLRSLGVGRGDRVVVYLPVIAETIVVTLAIARLGAIHSLVFGGFSGEALKFRVEDTRAKLLVTTDGQFRRGAAVPVKANADHAVSGDNEIEHVLVVRRTGEQTPDVPWTEGRDLWWHDVVDPQPDTDEPEYFGAETPLFIMYTSGTTGKPKGLVHTSGGYLTQANWTHWAVFDAKPDDVHWCTADLAWVTAHTYEIYGPLSNGLTQVIYEGTPDTPHPARHLEIIERYGVTTYYTAPTLVRTLSSWFPDGLPDTYDLSSLRLLGTVGEAINPEAWVWFHEQFGRGECPIVDTWWQSETGAAVMAPLPGVDTLKPGSSLRALPGLSTAVVDDAGERVPNGSGGYLVVQQTGPSLARTVWGDPERYRDSYWAKLLAAGLVLLRRRREVRRRRRHLAARPGRRRHQRVGSPPVDHRDRVVAVSPPGRRRGGRRRRGRRRAPARRSPRSSCRRRDPKEARCETPATPPSRQVWAPLAGSLSPVLRAHVADQIGPIAKPATVLVVPDLPKTRSGKIMRRLLGDISDGREPLGDTTSLQDETVPGRVAAILAEATRAS